MSEPLREWNLYPIDAKAFAIGGGHWTKTERGWKWCSGSTFQTPGGDAYRVELPRATTDTSEPTGERA